MADPAFVRSRCRTGPVDSDLHPALVQALAWLVQSQSRGAVAVLGVAAQTPDHLLPALVVQAANRNIDPQSMKALIDITTPNALRRAVGKKQAAAILRRYP